MCVCVCARARVLYSCEMSKIPFPKPMANLYPETRLCPILDNTRVYEDLAAFSQGAVSKSASSHSCFSPGVGWYSRTVVRVCVCVCVVKTILQLRVPCGSWFVLALCSILSKTSLVLCISLINYPPRSCSNDLGYIFYVVN